MHSLKETDLEKPKVAFRINSQQALIRELPIELLCRVIAFALPDRDRQPGVYYEALNAFRSVCSWFLAAIDSHPSFWTVLTIDCWPADLDAALINSGKLPVTAYGQEWLDGDSTPHAFIKAVAQERWRMRVVSLAFRGPAEAEEFFQLDTPKLTDADLAVVGNKNAHDHVETLKAPYLQSLHSLKLTNLILDSGSPLYSCLESLKLSNPYQIQLDRLISALGEAQAIKELIISIDAWEEEPLEPMQVTKIELDSLQTLSIDVPYDCNGWVAFHILSCIHARSCQSLDFGFSLATAQPGPPAELDPFGLRHFLRDLFRRFPALPAAINSAPWIEIDLGTGRMVSWKSVAEGGSFAQLRVEFWKGRRKFDYTPVVQELLCGSRAKVAKLTIDEDFFRGAAQGPEIVLALGARCIFQEVELFMPGEVREGLALLKELNGGDGTLIRSFPAVRKITLRGSAWSESTLRAYLTKLGEAKREIELVLGTSVGLSAGQVSALGGFSCLIGLEVIDDSL